MKTIRVWKVEGEGADGTYLDGDEFVIELPAKEEARRLSLEFTDNTYWIDSYEKENVNE